MPKNCLDLQQEKVANRDIIQTIEADFPSRREDRRRRSAAKAPKGFVAREGRRRRWLPEPPRKPEGSEAREARPTAKRSGAGRACGALRETNAKPKAERAGSRRSGTRQGAALGFDTGKPQACGARGKARRALERLILILMRWG